MHLSYAANLNFNMLTLDSLSGIRQCNGIMIITTTTAAATATATAAKAVTKQRAKELTNLQRIENERIKRS